MVGLNSPSRERESGLLVESCSLPITTVLVVYYVELRDSLFYVELKSDLHSS